MVLSSTDIQSWRPGASMRALRSGSGAWTPPSCWQITTVRGADYIAGKICWPQQRARGLKVPGPLFGFLVSHSRRARRNHRGSKNIPEKPLTEQPRLCLNTSGKYSTWLTCLHLGASCNSPHLGLSFGTMENRLAFPLSLRALDPGLLWFCHPCQFKTKYFLAEL